jgi:hypothetical protein
VTGAAITLRGSGFSAKGLTVSISGKRARILKRTARTLRFAVPKVRAGAHTVVVRSGAKKARIGLRVLTPFKGRVTATLETKNQKKAIIGPAGGNIEVKGGDGTRYTLVIPTGALAKDEAIRMTPVASFAGFPLTGGRISGVRLLPDGLVLSRQATLIVRGGGGFSPTTMGFSFGRTTGLEIAAATKAGSTRTVLLDHFSDHGTAAARAADFANLVQPLVNKLGPLSLSQIRAVVELMAIWEIQFADPNQFCFFTKCVPPSFCLAQPVCMQLAEKTLSSLEILMAAECSAGARGVKQGQGLGAIRTLQELLSASQLLGGRGDPATPCIHAIADDLTKAVLEALSRNPLEHFADQDLLPGDFRADLNANNTVTAWEFALRLSREVSLLGVQGADVKLISAYEAALTKIRTDGVKRCDTDQRGGGRDLREGFDYARELGSQTTEYLTALDACGVGVVIVPSNVELAPGEQKQFVAELTNVNLQGSGVTWSASTGFISISGIYTAPQNPGVYKVRATSDLNPNRFAEATVTVVQGSCVGPAAASVQRLSAAGYRPLAVQPGNVVITSPADIQALRAANITEITGNLTIGPSTTLVNLTGLEQLTTVGGSLTFSQNAELLTIEGLSGLRNVGGDIFVSENSKLIDLRGLEGVSTVTGFLSVSGNAALQSVNGLCGLTSVGKSAFVQVNPALTSVNALSGLTVAGGLGILFNDALTSVDGLEALTILSDPNATSSVAGAALASTTGLSNLQTIAGQLTVDARPEGGTMATFALPALQQVKYLLVIGKGPLQAVSFPALTQTGLSGFELRGPSNVSTVNMPALVNTGGFVASGIDIPVSVNLGPNAVVGDLRLTGPPSASAGGAVSITVHRVDRGVLIARLGGGVVNIGSLSDLTIEDNLCISLSILQISTPLTPGRFFEIHRNTGFTDAAAIAYLQGLGILASTDHRVFGNSATC